MNRFQLRAAQIPRPIAGAIFLARCGLAAYWWFGYAGLYRRLAGHRRPIAGAITAIGWAIAARRGRAAAS